MSTAPAVRRTYGRARAASPPADDERTTASLFAPVPVSESPSKSLLNRFASGKASFLGSLGVLGRGALAAGSAPASDDTDTDDGPSARTGINWIVQPAPADDEDGADDEDVRAAMDRMKREARGQVVSPPAAAKARAAPVALPLSKPPAPVLAGSSSLTELSGATSPLPSSPPRALAARTSSTADEETIPVRKLGAKASGRARRIVASDDEDDDDDRDGDDAGRHGRQVTASPALSDLFDRESTAEPAASATRRDDLYDELVREDQVDLRSESDKTVERSTDPVEMFDDEPDVAPKAVSKNVKMKGLNKQDAAAMQRDIARAQRAFVAKVKNEPLPITAWVAKAQKAVTQPFDRLTRDGTSPPETSSQQTPDDIAQFTPSSAARPTALLGLQAKAAAAASPTPLRPGKLHLVKDSSRARHTVVSDGDDDELVDPSTLHDRSASRDERAAALARRQAELKAMKEAALRGAMVTPKPPREANDDDDDIELVKETPAATVAPVIATRPTATRAGPSARAVLNIHDTLVAVTKNQQQHMRHAGKSKRAGAEADATESLLASASKFKHRELQTHLGGARPAGMKKGHDKRISQMQLDQTMRERHNAQARAAAAHKEERFGKGRDMPSRQEIDLDDLVAEAPGDDASAGDEDSEDDAFVPDDEVSAAYSGESEGEAPDAEAETEEDVEDGGAADSGDEADKENVPPTVPASDLAGDAALHHAGDLPTTLADDGDDADEPMVPVKRGRARPSRRVAFESDDDEPISAGAAVRAASPLRAVPPTAAADGAPSSGPDFDLGGFGDGSQGFSQLFGETQAADESEPADAFAGLRDAPVALLPANMLLPDVDISKTQIDRDNALIAGDGNDGEVDPTMPEKQYLNTQGFFTQTRPRTFEVTQTQVSDDEAGPSRRGMLADDTLLDIPRADTSPEQAMESSRTLLSPTQATPALRRLKRRTSPPPGGAEAMDVDGAEEVAVDSPVAAPRDAFAVMQRAAERNKRREERRALRAADSALVDAQAEESDDGDMWGPLGGADDDDDEADEGYVPDLLNDDERTEEQRRADEEQAAEKFREIAQADDARREAEAKKITEGKYRTKARGNAFLSDDEDGEGGGRRRWSKKQRRARRLAGEDGLSKLEGEENAFRSHYEQDLKTDDELDETPPSPDRRSPSPTPMDGRQRLAMLQNRARINTEVDEETQQRMLLRHIGMDLEDAEAVAISRSVRSVAVVHGEGGGTTVAVRSTETYAEYVRDEARVERRLGGSKNVSVVVGASTGGGGGGGGGSSAGRTSLGGRASLGARPAPAAANKASRALGRGSSSILLGKGGGFAQ